MRRMVLYEPEVLYAVIGYYNEAIWPAQLIAGLLALAALAYAVWPRRGGDRVIVVVLAAAWLWSGIAYLGDHYAQINWAGNYYEVAFAVQAALLLGYGLVLGALRFRFDGGILGWAALFLAAVAIVGHPLVEWVLGHPWEQMQVVGVAPDPTNLLTLALLLLCAGRVPWLLLIIPALWLVISGGWAWLLGTPDRIILPSLCLVALLLITGGRRTARRS